jgi:hypothetical protein
MERYEFYFLFLEKGGSNGNDHMAVGFTSAFGSDQYLKQSFSFFLCKKN